MAQQHRIRNVQRFEQTTEIRDTVVNGIPGSGGTRPTVTASIVRHDLVIVREFVREGNPPPAVVVEPMGQHYRRPRSCPVVL